MIEAIEQRLNTKITCNAKRKTMQLWYYRLIVHVIIHVKERTVNFEYWTRKCNQLKKVFLSCICCVKWYVSIILYEKKKIGPVSLGKHCFTTKMHKDNFLQWVRKACLMALVKCVPVWRLMPWLLLWCEGVMPSTTMIYLLTLPF